MPRSRSPERKESSVSSVRFSRTRAVPSAHTLDTHIKGFVKRLPTVLVTANEGLTPWALPRYTVVDSGGFLIALRNEYDKAWRYLPKLIEIYRRTPETFVLLSLDLPILPWHRNELEKRLTRTNIELYKRLSQREFGHRVAPVVHGWRPETWRTHIEGYLSASKPRIFAVGSFVPMLSPPVTKGGRDVSHRMNAAEVGRRLGRITRDLDRLGFNTILLGAGSYTLIPLAALLGYDLADSSTWRVAAMFGDIIVPQLGRRLKAREALTKYRDMVRRAYLEAQRLWPRMLPWSFEEWERLALERSQRGYVARALFNAAATKLIELEATESPQRATRMLEKLAPPKYKPLIKAALREAGGERFRETHVVPKKS